MGMGDESEAVVHQFQAVLHRGDVAEVIQETHRAQQKSFEHVHLALLLVDYWVRVVGCPPQGDEDAEAARREGLQQVMDLAISRRLREVYGESEFDRVFADLEA